MFAFLFMGLLLVPHTHAETATTNTTSVTVMMEKIKTLMAQLEELKKQLATVQGEVRETLKNGILEGTNSEDMKKIQELLATDPAIYPEGKVTGYFGPLTKEAIKRFQTKHNLDATGIVDDETKELMESYLSERMEGKLPQGLLRDPSMMKKMQERMHMKCRPMGEKEDMDEEHMHSDMHHGTSTRPGIRMMMEPEDNTQMTRCREMRMEHGSSREHMHDEEDMHEDRDNSTGKDRIRATTTSKTSKTQDFVVEIELTEKGWLKTLEVTILGSYTGSAPDSAPTRKATQSETWKQVLTEAAGLQLIEVRKLDPKLVRALKKEFEDEWKHYVGEDDDHGKTPREHATTTKDTQGAQKTVQAARKVIQAAEIAIKDADRAINIADGETEHEEEHLDEARAKIKEAHKALEAKSPLKAIALAKEATDLAEEIMDSL